MRWAFLLLLTIASCTHAPWNPHRGWTSWRTNSVELYTDAVIEQELTLKWLDTSFEVLSRTFFSSTAVPPVKVVYISNETTSPFTSDSGAARTFTANTRPPSAKGPLRVLVVGKAGTMEAYAHVMAHHFIEAAVPNAPVWLHAGLAPYLARFRSDPADRSRICFGHLQPIDGRWVLEPFDKLFTVSWQAYNDKLASNINDTSFTLVDFLMIGEQQQLRRRFDRLMVRLGEGATSADALAAVYPELPAATMEARYRDHVRTRRPMKDCPVAVPLMPATVERITPIKRAVPEEEVRQLFEELRTVPVRQGHADFPPPA